MFTLHQSLFAVKLKDGFTSPSGMLRDPVQAAINFHLTITAVLFAAFTLYLAYEFVKRMFK
jgi:hypothetical protein